MTMILGKIQGINKYNNYFFWKINNICKIYNNADNKLFLRRIT